MILSRHCVAAALLTAAASVSAAPAPAPMHNLADVPVGLVTAMANTVAPEAAADPAYVIDANGCARLSAGGKGDALDGCFGGQGPRFHTGTQRLGLRLTAWGRADHLRPVHLTRTAPHANQIAYQGDGLSEWWRVLPMGYEQGFTLDNAPAGSGEVVLQLSASRAPKVDHDTLVWGSLRYGKLQVIDASGKILPSHLTAQGRTIELAFDARDARFPVTVDPLVWTQQQITASDGVASDRFGSSVALSADGSTALVGATDKNSLQGAAYLYTLNASNGTWSQVAVLTASDGAASDRFGWSVALSADGGIALVGARDKTGSSAIQGAAYVYTKPNSGWTTTTEMAKLTASDPAFADNFGTSVALSANGSTALVGASGKNSHQGAVYVYTKPISGWATTANQTAKLTASDGAANDYFGGSVALSADGSTALVGANVKSILGVTFQGVAYVYTAPISGWATATETAELTAGDGAANDYFGSSVALSSNGGTALVGARNKTIGGNSNQGAAYVFTKPNSGWATTSTHTAELTGSDGAASDSFGSSVALSADGSTALVGALAKKVGANLNQGATYVYAKPISGWATTAAQTAEFTASDGLAGDYFGWSVALSADGTIALVGAPSKTVSGNSFQGAVYAVTDPSLSTVLTAPATVTTSTAFTVQYIVTNNGTASSADLKVEMPVPTGTIYSAISATQGTCQYDGTTHIATCDLGRLAGSITTATATLTLVPTATSGTITPTALVYGSPNLAQSAAMAASLPAAPTVTGTSDVTIVSGQSGDKTLTLTGGGALTITATSSDTTLLPNANITGASQCTAAGNCTLTLTPANGQTGTATVTVQVTDGHQQTTTGTFRVTVNAASSGSNDSSGGDSGSGSSGSGGGGGAMASWALLALGGFAFARRRRCA